MKKTHLFLFGAAAALTTLSGCQSEPGPYASNLPVKYNLENTEKFVVMDKRVRYSVGFTGAQEHTSADGRLEVVADIKNNENRRIQVQVSCVFKDEQGFPTEESDWQSLILGENATEAVHFASLNARAQKYTIRVRQYR